MKTTNSNITVGLTKHALDLKIGDMTVEKKKKAIQACVEKKKAIQACVEKKKVNNNVGLVNNITRLINNRQNKSKMRTTNQLPNAD